MNQWTRGLIAAGVVSFGAVTQAEEAPANQVLTAVSSTQISGYVSTSARWDVGSTAGLGAFSYGGAKADGFNLDVVDLTISKPLNEGEWAAGYAAELWLGPDVAGGLGTGAPAGNNFGIKQAYVALNAPVGNGIVLKMGVWDTIVGYEAANATANPNYTRSWGYTLEPTQHTGLLASYQLCDWASIVAGIADSTTAGINARVGAFGGIAQSEKAYMGGLSIVAPEGTGFLEGATLNAGVVDGQAAGARAGGFPANVADATLLYVGGTIPTPLKDISFGWAWDHLNIDNGADSDAIAAYAAWKATDKLTVNNRLEYFDNGGGLALGGVATGGASSAAGMTASELLSYTLTLDYALWANVITRAEWRWDHDVSGGNHLPGTVNTTTGAAGAGANNSHIVALNVIYKF